VASPGAGQVAQSYPGIPPLQPLSEITGPIPAIPGIPPLQPLPEITGPIPALPPLQPLPSAPGVPGADVTESGPAKPAEPAKPAKPAQPAAPKKPFPFKAVAIVAAVVLVAVGALLVYRLVFAGKVSGGALAAAVDETIESQYDFTVTVRCPDEPVTLEPGRLVICDFQYDDEPGVWYDLNVTITSVDGNTYTYSYNPSNVPHE
jgi:hypothetical protein